MYDGVVLTHALISRVPPMSPCVIVPHTFRTPRAQAAPSMPSPSCVCPTPLRHPPGPSCPLDALTPPVCVPHHSGTPRAQAAAADAIGHMCLPATLMLSTNGKDGKPQKVNPKLLVRGGEGGRQNEGDDEAGGAGRMKGGRCQVGWEQVWGPRPFIIANGLYCRCILPPLPLPSSVCEQGCRGAADQAAGLL